MIITRTPLRVSFAGGGSDLRAYYQKGRRAGAIGGKLLGSGCGGFLLLYCEEGR